MPDRDLWGNEIPPPTPKPERKPRPKREWRPWIWLIERDEGGLPCRIHMCPPDDDLGDPA